MNWIQLLTWVNDPARTEPELTAVIAALGLAAPAAGSPIDDFRNVLRTHIGAQPDLNGAVPAAAVPAGWVPPAPPVPAPPALVITTPVALPGARVGRAYTRNLVAMGGTPPYTWAAPGLSAWLTLTPAGVLSGTPPAGGPPTVNVNATVTDAAGATATRNFTLAVAEPVRLPGWLLPVVGLAAAAIVALLVGLVLAGGNGGDDATAAGSNGGKPTAPASSGTKVATTTATATGGQPTATATATGGQPTPTATAVPGKGTGGTAVNCAVDWPATAEAAATMFGGGPASRWERTAEGRGWHLREESTRSVVNPAPCGVLEGYYDTQPGRDPRQFVSTVAIEAQGMTVWPLADTTAQNLFCAMGYQKYGRSGIAFTSWVNAIDVVGFLKPTTCN